MTVTRIEHWKTSDGRTHKSERSALLHESERALWNFVLLSRIGIGGEWTTRMVGDWLVENSCDLHNLLAALENARRMTEAPAP